MELWEISWRDFRRSARLQRMKLVGIRTVATRMMAPEDEREAKRAKVEGQGEAAKGAAEDGAKAAAEGSDEDDLTEPLPRFEYAIERLVKSSDTGKFLRDFGFLAHCPFRREKTTNVDTSALLSGAGGVSGAIRPVKITGKGKVLFQLTGCVDLSATLEGLVDSIRSGELEPQK